MSTRRILGAGAILAIVSLGVVILRHDDEAESARIPVAPKASAPAAAKQQAVEASASNVLPNGLKIPTRDQLEGQPAVVAPQPGELTTTEYPALADKIGSPNTPPEKEAVVVLDLLKLYRRLFGAYPAGENNTQFVNALLGSNRDKLPLLPQGHPRINPKGELVDAWGSPFFFHQNSRNSVEVRSAGPDRLLFTDDDLVAGRRDSASEQAAVANEVGLGG